jgi:asparagine synthetase B (glutamine-hydrolysing)
MCGIAGLINKTGRLSREALTRLGTGMADSMAYRGPTMPERGSATTGTAAVAPAAQDHRHLVGRSKGSER